MSGNITRINNNQITDAVAGNVDLGIDASAKIQANSITANLLAANLVYGSNLTICGNLAVTNTISTAGNIYGNGISGNTISACTLYTPTIQANQVAFGNLYTGALCSSLNFVFDMESTILGVGSTTIASCIINTGNVSAAGNVTAANFTTTGTQGNITGANAISAVTLTAIGNVYGANIVGTYLHGCGSNISNIAAGTQIVNGTSNVSIATACGPITMAVNGGVVANIRATSIAIGTGAGLTNPNFCTIAIGGLAGQLCQGCVAVAIGLSAGQTFQGPATVAVGINAGIFAQGVTAVAVGAGAGACSQGQSAVAVGNGAGSDAQRASAIAIGAGAAGSPQLAFACNVSWCGNTLTLQCGVACGTFVPGMTLTNPACGPSFGAGVTVVTVCCNALTVNFCSPGPLTGIQLKGSLGQQSSAIAIGRCAGAQVQGTNAIAIGRCAGLTAQQAGAVAIGRCAGQLCQADSAVAIGICAGTSQQHLNAVAVGSNSGRTNQGQGAVAIGAYAGFLNQANNTIILNASCNPVNGVACQPNSFYVDPIRDAASAKGLFYNPCTKEVTYSCAASGGAGNVISCGSSNVKVSSSNVTMQIGCNPSFKLNAAGEIAIGTQAGNACQGINSIAIGRLAGPCNQSANTIILNATGSAVNGVACQTNSFYVAPIRSVCAAGNTSLYYCTTTKEVTSGPLGSSYGNAEVATYLASGTVTTDIITIANISANNFTTAGSGGDITGANVISGVTLTATGNVYGSNVVASYLWGDGSNISGLPAGYSNADVSTYLASGTVTTDIITTANITANNFTTAGSSGNIYGANIISAVTLTATGNVYGANVVGTYLYGCGSNITGISIGNSILNGTSNVSITSTNGPITMVVNGTLAANISSAQLAIGRCAGVSCQQACAIAIGVRAGEIVQQVSAIAIGSGAGRSNQQACAIAIGHNTARITQHSCAIAIGTCAGVTCQGNSSIAIGAYAGVCLQANNTIILNATSSALNGVACQANSFYVAPIRSVASTTDNTLVYNATTKEITSGPPLVGNTAGNKIQVGVGACAGGAFAIAIGGCATICAGPFGFCGSTIVIGSPATAANCTAHSVAIGQAATITGGSQLSVIVGACTIAAAQGAVAIGYNASVIAGATDGIAIGRATSAIASGFYVAPIRCSITAGATPAPLGYCIATDEIVYGAAATSNSISSGSSSVSIPTTGGPVVIASGGSNVFVLGSANSAFTGNLNPSANATYSLGNATNQWKELHVSNTTIYIGCVPLSSADNQLVFNGNPVVTANVDGTSNTTGNMNIVGSVSATYLYGCGANITGITASANTGNVTFNNNIVIGTGDSFGGGGLNLAIGPDSIANGNVQYLQVRGGDVPTHIHLDTGDNTYYDQYFGDDNKFVRLDAGIFGNVTIGTENPGLSYRWTFDNTGNLVLPAQNVGNATGDGTPGESQLLRGGRKIINGVYSGATNPFAVELPSDGTPTLVYSSEIGASIYSAKVTIAVQSTGSVSNWEQFDVALTIDYLNGGQVAYVVSNRVAANANATPSVVTAVLGGGNELQILVQLPAGVNGWASFDATEFGLMVD